MIDRVERFLAAREGLVLALLLPVLLLPILAGIQHEVWVDEAYTLLRFSSNGFFYPFTDYHVPNNHILFSALLSLWWQPGMDLLVLRAPLVAFHIASLVIIYLWLRGVCGRRAALLSLLIYASSWVIGSFALELRGYSLSFTLVLLNCCSAWHFSRCGSEGSTRVWAALYALTAIALILTIPTNLVVVMVVALWAVLGIQWQQGWGAGKVRGVFLICAPLLGLLPYFGLMDDLLEQSQFGWSRWSRFDVLAHYFAVLITSTLPAVLVVIVATLSGKLQWRCSRIWVSLLVLAAMAVVAFTLLTPTPPFPRSLLSLSPLFLLPMGVLAAQSIRGASPWLIPVLILSVLITSEGRRQCSGTSFWSTQADNLCYQRHNDNLQVSSMIEFLREKFNGATVNFFADINAGYELDASLKLNPQPVGVGSLAELAPEFLVTDGFVTILLLSSDLDLDQALTEMPEQSLRLLPIYASPHCSAWQAVSQ